MEIPRTIEQSIATWAQTNPTRPLLVRGARRVGKTYSVERVGRTIAQDAFVKLDFQTDLELISSLFDGPTDDIEAIVRRIEDYKRISLDKRTAFIMFDEVQLCERALNSLRFFSGSSWRVAATGSQLGVATKNRTLPFPSGVEQITMHPLTFEEFLLARGENQMAAAIRAHAESLETYSAHEQALRLYHEYQVVGGMPAVVAAFIETGSLDEARVQQREIDEIYTSDMTDPENGISGIAARKLWRSITAQLLRASTKKFKYSEVERGGRRAKLLEPLEWLAAAGFISINEMTQCTEAPLVPYDETEGSFFKVYMADTGLMFYKCGINPRLWLEALREDSFPVSSDFAGALAENSVMQAMVSNNLQMFYWTAPASWGTRGEIDFLLQDDLGRLVPIEVKSGRNVRAKSLATFMRHVSCPYAVVFSENNFGRATGERGEDIRFVPLYAAHCLGEACLSLG